MTQIQKYIWLIDTILRKGKITLEELSACYERNKSLSDGLPLSRATFNRWRDDILLQLGIIISCSRDRGYRYFIENAEAINEDKVKKWMLDTFAVGNLISENLTLTDRILVNKIPSGQENLTLMIEAMRENRVVQITYKAFIKDKSYTFDIEPYCVKFFENRWYVLARSPLYDNMRVYGLDRIEAAEITDSTFMLPKDFSAEEYYSPYYGIVSDSSIEPERIVVRAHGYHIAYMKSLPLHHSQKLMADNGDYADFELYLAPTYDFIMSMLQKGAMAEVISPTSLRQQMKQWISRMSEMYSDD